MTILWPAFALFALTMCVVIRLGTLRWRAVARRQVDPRFYKIHRGDGEPEEVAVVYSFIHLGANDVLWRFRVFALSWLALLAYWVVLAVELATAPGPLSG